MPFWLHEHHLLRSFKSLTRHHLFLITFSLVTIVSVVWLFFIYLPLSHQLSCKTQETSCCCLQLQKCQCNDAACLLAAQKNTNLTQSFNQICATCQSFQKNISLTLQLLEKHQISCRDVQQKALIKKDFYKKGYVVVEGKSEFKKIMQFLHDVEEQKLPIAFESFSLRRDKNGMVKMHMLLRLVTLYENAPHV